MTGPAPHPGWCDRDRGHGDLPAHIAQVGADLELSDSLAYIVELFQPYDRPAEVHLTRHTPDETIQTRLSILEAAILRDLLGEGLGLIAREAGL